MGQLRVGEGSGLVGHGLGAILGHGDEAGGDGIGHGLEHKQVAEAVEQVGSEAAGFLAAFDDGIDKLEERGLVTGGEGGDGVVDDRNVRDTEERAREIVGEAIGASTGEELVEDGQGIARGTAARGDDHGVDGIFDRDTLSGDSALEQALHRGRGEQAERVVVRARTDGGQHLLQLGGGEDEDDVLRRLLDDLEQRVEARIRNHVGLVDDEDAVARLGRREVGAVAQIAHVVHAVMRSGVELRDVQIAGAAGGERDAGIAHAAGRRGGALLAVERAGHDARGGGLATAARAGKQVGVINTPRVERGGQGPGDLLLAYHLGEGCWTIFPVKSHDCTVYRLARAGKAGRRPERRQERRGVKTRNATSRGGRSQTQRRRPGALARLPRRHRRTRNP